MSLNQTPFAIGDKVRPVHSVACLGLESLKLYVIAERLLRPMFPGGPERWFYRMDGFTRCNVYHEFIVKAL